MNFDSFPEAFVTCLHLLLVASPFRLCLCLCLCRALLLLLLQSGRFGWPSAG